MGFDGVELGVTDGRDVSVMDGSDSLDAARGDVVV